MNRMESDNNLQAIADYLTELYLPLKMGTATNFDQMVNMAMIKAVKFTLGNMGYQVTFGLKGQAEIYRP